ncbi:MAG TPA: hypothetical protein VFK06_20775 [Candidatus Angelobacter sp.]|nr:hypothetical protein [Candidatus Angelobacter sp.]
MMDHRVLCGIAFLLLLSCYASGQQIWQNREVRLGDLPVRTAQSTDSMAVLVAELETIFHDPAVCCGKNSALEDTVRSADPLALKEFSTKLQGRHRLSDGRLIMVTAEYLPQESINADWIITALVKKHALLMEWDSHLYVLYGAVFNEMVDENGQRDLVIQKLLLLDSRFSDARREASFDRATDDFKKVQGLLMLSVPPQ